MVLCVKAVQRGEYSTAISMGEIDPGEIDPEIDPGSRPRQKRGVPCRPYRNNQTIDANAQ